MIIFSHTVNMFFEISFLNKMGKGILFKVRYGTGVKGKFFIKFVYQMHRKHHITNSDRRS